MFNKLKSFHYAFIAVSVPIYFLFAYFVQREDFLRMICLYAILFAAFIYYYQKVKGETDLGSSLKIAFFFRLVFLFALPALSNDFYRFIWDGRMSVLGINPYLVLPKDFVGTPDMVRVGSDAVELLEGQGSMSPGNYTCYPPVNQFVFLLPAFLFPGNILGSVIVMRVILILSDLGTIFYARKILQRLGLPQSNILLFALNPFIIIEMTGNLHFEGLTVFFLVFSIYLLLKEKQKFSAVMLAIAASVKLIPLLFLPFFLKKLGQWNSVKYYLIVGVVSIVLFLPFFSINLVENFMSSIDLYFRKFEFNASFYYLFREIGFHLKGWNIIQKLGPILGLASFIVILILT
ncbi:MAG: mannosyltransferase, partial [Bacteroidetes bacterium]